MRKVLIIGHGRHGKDTVAQMLHEEFGYSFASSSEFASRLFIYDALKEKYNYLTSRDCFLDRETHRDEWHDLIAAYNSPDKARLARAIMQSNDIYVGMRNDEELAASLHEKLFDLVIGVFDPRKPLEPPSSFKINLWAASDVILPNSQGLPELAGRIRNLKPLLT